MGGAPIEAGGHDPPLLEANGEREDIILEQFISHILLLSRLYTNVTNNANNSAVVVFFSRPISRF